jgi:hypothetical protein
MSGELGTFNRYKELTRGPTSEIGFVLYDKMGVPCVTFGYGSLMNLGWLGSTYWRR